MDPEEVSSGEEEERAQERVVLGFVLEHHPAQLSHAELVTALKDDIGMGEVGVADGVARLARAGLVHRHDDEFVWATRAAVRGSQVGL